MGPTRLAEGGTHTALAAIATPKTLVERVAGVLGRAGVTPGTAMVVAVSGGGDSVALLRVLLTLGPPWNLRLTAAHLDHGLRGATAAEDRAFVADLCALLGVPLVAARVDVRAEAMAAGVSLEMAARDARRRFLGSTRVAVGADWIALAHHADDQAETLLLRLGRGSGPIGAGAMTAVVGRDHTLRPLLGEQRATLRAYLDALGQPWREDESNAEPWTERNRLRLSVLPPWQAVHPGLTPALARSAGYLRDDGELLAAAVDALLPPPVCDNGGPWRLVPWSVWTPAARPLRRQLLRQAAWSVAGVYPPAAWVEAWADWPERAAARHDLAWLRVASGPGAAVIYRPAAGPGEVALPTALPPWQVHLPDGAVVEAAPLGYPGSEAPLPLGDGAAVRHLRTAERVGPGGIRLRDILRARGVPAVCRGTAWVVSGHGGVWLPGGAEAVRRVLLRDGSAVELRYRAAAAWRPSEHWPTAAR